MRDQRLVSYDRPADTVVGLRMELVEIHCDCGRQLKMAPRVLARRPTCMYCGAKLAVPEVHRAAVATEAPALAPEKNRKPVTASCPTCGGNKREPGANVGKLGRCQRCGCPYVVPELRGPGLDVPVDYADAPPVVIRCPACAVKLALPAAFTAQPCTCTGCSEVVDLAKHPLSAILATTVRADEDDVTRAAVDLLDACWRGGQQCVAEPDRALRHLARLDWWDDNRHGRSEVGPVPPEWVAKLTQKCLLNRARTEHMTLGDGAYRLTVWDEPGAGDPTAGEKVAGLVAANAVGLGLLALTGYGFYATPSIGDDDEKEERFRPAVILDFTLAKGGGCDLSGVLQSAPRTEEPLGEEQLTGFATTIRQQIGPLARAYVAFQAAYGPWVPPEAFVTASRDLLAARIARRCPSRAGRARSLASTILAPVALR